MLRLSKNVLAVMICVFFVAGALNVNARDLKIGFVDSQALADAHPEYKKKLDKIEKMMAEDKALLKKKNEELIEFQKSLGDNPLASDVIKEKQKQEIDIKRKEMAKLFQQFQMKLKSKEQKYLPDDFQKKILKDVMTAIRMVSKTEGYEVIYELNKGNVVYTEDSLDITDRAKKKLIEIVANNTDTDSGTKSESSEE